MTSEPPEASPGDHGSDDRFGVEETRLLTLAAETSGQDARDNFDAFDRLTRPWLEALAGGKVRSVVDAEELVQETLVRAWRYRHGFRRKSALAWLYSILRNLVSDYRRGQRRRAKEVPLELVDCEAPGSDEHDEQTRVTRQKVWDCVNRSCPPSERECLYLDFAGASSATIATIRNCSVSAVYTLRSQARKRLGLDPELREFWNNTDELQ